MNNLQKMTNLTQNKTIILNWYIPQVAVVKESVEMVIQRKDSEIRRLKALLGGGSPKRSTTTVGRVSTKGDVQNKFRKNLVAGASKARAGISAGIVQQNFQVSIWYLSDLKL